MTTDRASSEDVSWPQPTPDRTCSECGADWHQLMDCKTSTLVCLVCGHVMPAEGVPDAPDDLLAR